MFGPLGLETLFQEEGSVFFIVHHDVIADPFFQKMHQFDVDRGSTFKFLLKVKNFLLELIVMNLMVFGVGIIENAKQAFLDREMNDRILYEIF